MEKEDNVNKDAEDNHIAIFKGKAIRRKLVNGKWF